MRIPDPGSEMEKFGSWINILDPQHCKNKDKAFTPSERNYGKVAVSFQKKV